MSKDAPARSKGNLFSSCFCDCWDTALYGLPRREGEISRRFLVRDTPDCPDISLNRGQSEISINPEQFHSIDWDQSEISINPEQSEINQRSQLVRVNPRSIRTLNQSGAIRDWSWVSQSIRRNPRSIRDLNQAGAIRDEFEISINPEQSEINPSFADFEWFGHTATQIWNIMSQRYREVQKNAWRFLDFGMVLVQCYWILDQSDMSPR